MADVTLGAQTAQYSPTPEREQIFAAAMRHSARVRFLRVALLFGVVATVALLIAIAVFDPFGRLAGGVSIDGVGLDGTKVTMEHPKLTGFRKDGRPYMVNAKRAVQDALHPTVVELIEIDADVALADNGTAHMIAKSGVYDSVKEHMDLSESVHIKSSQYDVQLKSANIDFKSGVYVSNDPVVIVTTNGTTISAEFDFRNRQRQATHS